MVRSLAEFAAIVSALGSRVDMEFERIGGDPLCLPEIAAAELEAIDLEIEFDAAAIQAFLARTECGQQPDLIFSNLPLTFFRSKNVYIEALIWTSSTTTIHQHGFSGAFKVVCGSSLHTRYTFNRAREVTPSLAIGTLASTGSEILERGAVRHIWPGEKLAHSLFHLDNPSITLVVRTFRLPAFVPQYSYFEPGVQIDEPGLEMRESVKMAGRLLFTARSVGRGELESAWRAICMSMSVDQVSWLFLKMGSTGFFGSELSRATEVFMETFGGEHRLVIEALDWLVVKNRIASVRQVIDDKDLRFLLALLMTAPDRSSIHQAVRCRYPGEDAERLVARWLAELTVGKQVLERALEGFGARLQSRGGAAFHLSHELRAALGGSTDLIRVEGLFAQALGAQEGFVIDAHAVVAMKARLAAIRDVAVLFSPALESMTPDDARR